MTIKLKGEEEVKNLFMDIFSKSISAISGYRYYPGKIEEGPADENPGPNAFAYIKKDILSMLVRPEW